MVESDIKVLNSKFTWQDFEWEKSCKVLLVHEYIRQPTSESSMIYSSELFILLLCSSVVLH